MRMTNNEISKEADRLFTLTDKGLKEILRQKLIKLAKEYHNHNIKNESYETSHYRGDGNFYSCHNLVCINLSAAIKAIKELDE